MFGRRATSPESSISGHHDAHPCRCDDDIIAQIVRWLPNSAHAEQRTSGLRHGAGTTL
jgi:hypothetical protein